LVEDGDFGVKTEIAVKRFQQQSGLEQDGTVGPATRTALGIKLEKPRSPVTAERADSDPEWLKIAKAEHGVEEIALPGRHEQRIVEYHRTTTLEGRYADMDETPWCSSFVNWVMTQAGYSGTNNALAASWLDWGLKMTTPKRGAITVIKKINATSDAATGSSTGNHVAFYLEGNPGWVKLLGGNQRDSVRVSTYSLSKYQIRGYRWPE
jgi:uncharacterized protein (TIGR02594 family)